MRHRFLLLATFLTGRFPFIAVVFSAIAVLRPELFNPLKPAIVPLLGLVMFGMGMTLTTENFLAVLRRFRVVGLGAALQFLLMPLLAWAISLGLGLPPQLLAGMVLVGASPGGTASNVICYLSKGDVALSITLTAVSTIAAVLLTPWLTWLYAGQSVPVPVLPMLFSVVKIVLLPVALGVATNTWARRFVQPVKEFFPALSVAAIVLIIAIIVAINQPQLAQLAMATVIAVMLHNLLGLTGGYWVPHWLGHDERTCRTLAIEVGMQNSGLAVALAVKHFSATAALPGAVFSIWHNLSGASLATHWARHSVREP